MKIPCSHARPFADSPCFEMGRPEGPEGLEIQPCPNHMLGEEMIVFIRDSRDGARIRRYYRPVRLADRWTFEYREER